MPSFACWQLVAGLDENERVSCEVNLNLARGKGYCEQEGMVRLRVELSTWLAPEGSLCFRAVP